MILFYVKTVVIHRLTGYFKGCFDSARKAILRVTDRLKPCFYKHTFKAQAKAGQPFIPLAWHWE